MTIGYHVVPREWIRPTAECNAGIMCIAQEVLNNPEPYEQNAALKTPVMLDNGAFEYDALENINEYVKAANICAASTVVIPDEMCKKDKTLDKLQRYGEELRCKLPEGVKTAFVVQGEDFNSWYRCMEEAAKHENLFDIVCLNKIIPVISKITATDFVSSLLPEKQIHWLGCDGVLSEWAYLVYNPEYCMRRNIVGIDTCKVFTAFMHLGRDLLSPAITPIPLDTPYKRPDNYFDIPLYRDKFVGWWKNIVQIWRI